MEKQKKIPVEVYSRVVGYFRPVNQWNKGKREEFSERKQFKLNPEDAAPVYEFKGNS
jgi:anaerobic ribonucleoside-triphosphate reductase